MRKINNIISEKSNSYKYILVSITILSGLINGVEFVPGPFRLYFFLCIQTCITLLLFNEISHSYLKNSNDLKSKFCLFKLFYLILILFLIIELINFRSVQSLKLPGLFMFYYLNILTSMIIFIRTSMELDNLINTLVKFMRNILLVALIFSLINILIPNKVIWIENRKFLENNYFLLRSIRQHVIGQGLNTRYASFFVNVNGFGEFAFLFLVINSFKNKTLFDKNNVLTIIALTLSKSRNSILASILFFLLYLMFSKSILKRIVKFTNRLIFVMIASFIFIFLLYNLQLIPDIFNGRLEIWSFSIGVFKNSPFIGIGTKLFSNQLFIQGGWAHAHNSFLQLMASGGIFYLFSYTYYLHYLFKTNNLLLYSEADNKSYLILNAFFVSTIFYQLFENRLLVIYVSFNILIFLGFALKIRRRDLIDER